LSLSTNATQLARHAQALKAAGVSRLNVSLDSLRRDCMTEVTGRDSLPQILEGLMAAKAAGLAPIKINMVAMQGVNEHDIEAMVGFCIEHGFILRLIEAMPMGDTGRNAQYLDVQPVLARLRDTFGLAPQTATLGGGPARYWATTDGRFTLGVISPISQHFCATCNRVRLSVDGTLYMCLGQEESVALRPLLRAGISDTELENVIRDAIELKPERHEFREQPGKVVRIMAKTGG
jgi:cyclic pyranopterin phosphate synthase